MTMIHHAVLILFCTILGACLGSFLNVCAYRIPRGMSVLRPRSRCPHCGTAILARDNVPVLGWLMLRGRCRECRTAISPRYAVVELAVGLLFAVPYLCAVALTAGDPWERIGAAGVIGILLTSWLTTALGVFAMIVGRDARWCFNVPHAPGRRRAGGGAEAPAAIAPRSRGDRGSAR